MATDQPPALPVSATEPLEADRPGSVQASATLGELMRAYPLPRLELRALMMAVTGVSATYLLAHPDSPVGAEHAERFTNLAKRRLDGEPLAYLLGQREFYGLTLQVTPDVLIPRADTEVLVEAAITRLPAGGRVLDLGTGSGAIALALASQRPDAQIHASDRSAQALACAQRNAQALGLRLPLWHGDWYAAIPAGTPRFDLLVSNPPYIAADDDHLAQGDLRFEPRGALTDEADGLQCLRMLAAGAPRWLQPGGWLLLEHGWQQGEAVRRLMQAAGFQNSATLRDLEGRDRVSIGQWHC